MPEAAIYENCDTFYWEVEIWATRDAMLMKKPSSNTSPH
jgi:hypothetical protein